VAVIATIGCLRINSVRCVIYVTCAFLSRKFASFLDLLVRDTKLWYT
jgi:hypothetical protein